MNVDIKNLVDLNKGRRQDFLTKRKDNAFEAALSKIKQALEDYEPEKDILRVDIYELLGSENAELCKDIVKYLKKDGIECEYQYVAGWSDEHESSPACYYVIFKF